MDYTKWPTQSLQVTNLQLDVGNPRLPNPGAPRSQRELIGELVKHDKVYELAKRISRKGWYPVESLIGTKLEPSGKVVVLEGNRRLAALKLLISPELAGEGSARFRRLSKNTDRESIRKVAVLIAPDREAAGPLISDKHTREQVARWSPIMQANFFRSLVSDGCSSQDLQDQYGIPLAQAAAFLRRSTLYGIACGLELPERAAVRVRNPRRFPSSTLDRLLDNPKAMEFLGIKFEADKGLRGHVPAEEFKKAFGKIVEDIANGEATSRDLNTVDAQDSYLKKISAWRPNPERKGSFTATDLIQQSPVLADSVAGSAGLAGLSSGPRTSTSLIPHGQKCRLKNRRIREVFVELRRLPLTRFPNSAAVMLRVLLELAMAHHFERTGKDKVLLNRIPAERRARDHALQLSVMMRYVVDEDNILNPHGLKALGRVVKGQHTALSLETMNLFVHSHYSTPSPQELRALWDAIQPLMDVILVEPTVPAMQTAQN